MLEYLIIAIGILLVILMITIYKKIDQKNNQTQDIKNEVLSEKLNEKIDKLIEKSAENQLNLSEKLTSKQNESQNEIKSVVSNLNERLARIDKAQEEINEIKTSVIDFKNLFSVYLESSFFPIIDKIDFNKEGNWHEFSDKDNNIRELEV